MGTQYPGAIDDWADPVASPPGTETLASSGGGRKHSQQHSDLQEAVKALETKLGITASTDPSSVIYQLAQVVLQLAGKLAVASNLSDLQDVSLARDNLGLGTAAVADTSDFDMAGSAASALAMANTYTDTQIVSLASVYVPLTRTVNGHPLSSNVTVSKGDVGLGSVENTALSTWPGSSNIVTVGTLSAGSIPYSLLTGTPATGVSSVFARTGAVVAAGGDYSASQVTNAADVTAANTFLATTGQVIVVSDSGTFTRPAALTLSHRTSGTPLTTFGLMFNWKLHDSTNTEVIACQEQLDWIDPTHGASTAQRKISVLGTDGSQHTGITIQTFGAVVGCGFNGAAATTPQASPDLGSDYVTRGLATGTPTFAASNLTGTTLPSGITSSSLTSFGTSPALTGTPTAPTAAGGTNTQQIATTAFVTSAVATAVTGTLKFQGSTDCSTNPNYPAALKGDTYVVSVAGKIGGASGTSVSVGDQYFATADNAGGTQAAVGGSWDVLEHVLQGALLSANNLSDVANAATAVNNLGGASSTGSGGLVRTTSPALTTPNIGVATASSVNGNTITSGTGTLTLSTFTLTVTGTASVSGTNTGDQTNISGNAATATALQTGRAINGVTFDGTAAITVACAASTLTGTTLASGVTASSLTSFGASPALGTPASGVLTNCTGTAAGLTAGTANNVGTGVSTGYIYGFPLAFGSASTVVVGFPNANAPASVCRDSADAAFITLAGGTQYTVSTGTHGAALGDDSFTGPGTVTVSGASKAVTGTSTTFSTSFGTRTLTGTTSTTGTAGTGSGTKYLSELRFNDLVGNSTGYARITAIASDTAFTTSAAIPGGNLVNATVKAIEQPTIKINTNVVDAVDTITSNTSLATVTNQSAQTGQAYIIGRPPAFAAPTGSFFLFIWLAKGGSGTTAYFSTQSTAPFGVTGYTTSVRQLGSAALTATGNIAGTPVTVAGPAGAAMERQAAQSIPNNAETKVILDTINWSSPGMASLSDSKIYIWEPGVYLVAVKWNIALTAAGQVADVRLYRNGSFADFARLSAGGAQQTWAGTFTGIIPMSAGDNLEFRVLQNSGGAVNTYTDTPWDTPQMFCIKLTGTPPQGFRL